VPEMGDLPPEGEQGNMAGMMPGKEDIPPKSGDPQGGDQPPKGMPPKGGQQAGATKDAVPFNEEDHPRADNGEFGNGKVPSNEKSKKQLSNTEKPDKIENNETASKTLHQIESEHSKLSNEVGTIISSDGKVLNVTQGQRSAVAPPVDLLSGNIFTHNHPGDGTFTVQDIKSLIKHGLFELRASTPQGISFSLKSALKHNNPNILDGLNDAGMGKDYQCFIKAQMELMKEVGPKNVTEKMVLKRLDDNMRKWLKENAEQYGYVYTEGTV
jgi:hypothetical protein